MDAPKLVRIKDEAKAKATTAMHGAKQFYAKHGVAVRAVANTGVYVSGCVIGTVATTTAGKAVGLSLAILGTIGLIGSAVETVVACTATPKSAPASE